MRAKCEWKMTLIKQVIFSICLLLLSCYQLALASEEVTLWTYYDFPPFSVDTEKGEGLSYDFANYLNEKAIGKDYRFNVVYLPRPRLNATMNAVKKGVVLWPTPSWFGDTEQKKYLWTNAIFDDRNEVISNTKIALEYRSPFSLQNYVFGGVFGHKYSGVEELCNNEIIICERANKEVQNIRKLVSGRIDITIMASTAARYIEKKNNLTGKLHFSNKPHSQYSRRILLYPGMEPLQQQLNSVIDQMNTDPEWKLILAKYGITPNYTDTVNLISSD